MSDPITKKEYSLAKDKRQQPAPDKAVSRQKKAKKEKPVKIWAKWASPRWMRDREPFVWGRYKSEDVASKVIKDQKRKMTGQVLEMSLDKSELE